MQIYCDNKGCYKETEALLNKDTNEVICQACNKSISSITEFMKKTMIDLNQVFKSKKVIPNGVFCEKCKKTVSFEMNENKFLCQVCKNQIKLSPVMENFFKQKNKKDV